MKKLKEAIWVVESLKKSYYNWPIVVTVDTSPNGIRRVINQVNGEGDYDPIRFKSKVLNEQQKKYTQVALAII